MTRGRVILRLTSAFAFQVGMVAALVCFESAPRQWLPNLFGSVALIVPLTVYMAMAYQGRRLGNWPRPIRAGLFALASLSATFCGFVPLLLGESWFKGSLAISETRLCLAIPLPAPAVASFGRRFFSGLRSRASTQILMPFFSPTATHDERGGAPKAGAMVTSPQLHRWESLAICGFFCCSHMSVFPREMSTSNKQILFDRCGLKSALEPDGKLISDTRIQIHGREGREWKFDEI